ncbi:hypothetical protein [Variovorax sp. YR752]|uniref:hypothetical protein n=1 Tax=Variovorax sp. YR752 TaxID=1884383 RepID=UPI003137E1A1
MQTRSACAAALTSLAAAGAAAAPPAAEMTLRSCVSGSPALRVPASAERATLDAADSQRFDAAAQARYPLYQRGGFAPYQVLMLRRGGQWLYVTLWRDGRSSPCFSAVFAADRFDFTPGWLAKYQPRAHETAD